MESKPNHGSGFGKNPYPKGNSIYPKGKSLNNNKVHLLSVITPWDVRCYLQ